ncbi:hypothetical protein HaLaN_07723 [Haematococcus lacustris]|uniref:Uncharacterized protein n=1 Tax=Haematococcus lacustris TaxID=44745 RepID=A0A699YS52_HAELA|nr:hypothetical protein HaLaN_07723 [Haematococcus lacustris]
MATLPAHRFLVTSPMGEAARVTATLVPGNRPSIPPLRHVFPIEVTRHHFTFKHGAVQATEALASSRVASAAAALSEEASRRTDLILRPDGRVYRGQHARKKLLEDLSSCGSQRFYETVLTVHPGATQVSGISLEFCQFKDDHVDDSFAAPFYVAYSTADGGLQPAYPNPLGPRQLGLLPTQAEHELPPLELAPVQAMWAAGQLSVPLRVMDADSQGGRLVWRREYGRFWLRQAPRPASLRALPLDPQGPTLALDNLSGGHALATPSGQLRRFRVWRAASTRKDCSEPAGALLDPTFCLLRPRAAHGLSLEDWKAVDMVYFVLYDQWQIPIWANQHVQQHLEQHLQVTPALQPGAGHLDPLLAAAPVPHSFQWNLGVSLTTSGSHLYGLKRLHLSLPVMVQAGPVAADGIRVDVHAGQAELREASGPVPLEVVSVLQQGGQTSAAAGTLVVSLKL